MRYGVVLCIMLLAACAPVDVNQPVPEPVEEVVEPEPAQDPVEVAEPEPVAEPDPDVTALFARSGEVKSYSFTLARLPKTSGEHTYYVAGDRVKIELVTPSGMTGFSADFLFLDRSLGSAYAYCLELRGCMKDEVREEVPFADHDVTLPHEWFDAIAGGKPAGMRQFNNRPVTAVAWEDDGSYYEALVDNFYGYPQRVAIFSDEGREEVVGGYEYQAMAFNKIDEKDVTPPY